MKYGIGNLGQRAFLAPPWAMESYRPEPEESRRRRRLQAEVPSPFVGTPFVIPESSFAVPMKMDGARLRVANLGQTYGCAQQLPTGEETAQQAPSETPPPESPTEQQQEEPYYPPTETQENEPTPREYGIPPYTPTPRGYGVPPYEPPPSGPTGGTGPVKKLQLYHLEVVNGKTSGDYQAGAVIKIFANPPPKDQTFDSWTGDVATVVNPTAANTVVNMPPRNTTVIATFKGTTSGEGYQRTFYTLTVKNGTPATGKHQKGDQPMITADAAPSGQVFDKWTGDVDALKNPAAQTTMVTMPAKDTTVTATYKPQTTGGTTEVPPPGGTPTPGRTSTEQPKKYHLTVNSGSGSGDYEFGQNVPIQANPAPGGQEFDQWTGTTIEITNFTSPNSSVVMPAADVTVTANYKPLSVATPGGCPIGTRKWGNECLTPQEILRRVGPLQTVPTGAGHVPTEGGGVPPPVPSGPPELPPVATEGVVTTPRGFLGMVPLRAARADFGSSLWRGRF